MNNIDNDNQSTICSQCGATLIFDPATQTMKCEYCEGKFNINDDGAIKENDINETLKNIKKENWTGVKVLKCDSCGSQVVVQNQGVSTSCSFCGSSHIVVADEPAGFVPDGVIPFIIPKEMVLEKYKKSVRDKVFISRKIKKMNPENIKGAYIPYWTYDAVVDSKYDVEAGSYYYISVSDKKKRQTKWEWRSGSDNTFFNDVISPAFSKKYLDKNCQNDFDFNLAKPYNIDYLSGFEVDKPVVPITEGLDYAKSIIQKKVTESIIKTIHSDTYKNLDIKSEYSNITYKLILAPIWIVSYTYKGKTYHSIVNGQNGSVKVDAPLSKKRLLAVVAAVMIVLFAFGNLHSRTGNYEQTNQISSITSLEIGNDDIWVEPDDINFYETIMVNYESPNEDDYKNIVWVSSNPNVATIKGGNNAVNYFYGHISVHKEGQAEIYAQTVDGSVVSNKILLVYGDKQQGKCYISSMTIDEDEKVWVGSEEKEKSIELNYQSPFTDENQYIQWVSSNPSVATVDVSSDKTYGGNFKGEISFLSEGETEIYAQTADGTILSNKIKYTYGNKFNKEEAVKNNVSEYVFEKLKYNLITGERPNEIKTGYFKTWYGKERYPIKYEEYTKLSEIHCDPVDISDDNSISVTGSANTFNANALAVTCNFSLKLQYNTDFNEYQVVSEQYDMPELIRDSVN